MCISVPTIVGSDGSEKVLEIPLDEKEQKELEKSAQEIREILEKVGI